MEVVADTTVLIDLWRYRRTPRRVRDLTAKVGDAAILIPWITQAEFSRGALFKDVSTEALAEFYASFHLLPFDQVTLDVYCRLWVTMARAGRAPVPVSRYCQRRFDRSRAAAMRAIGMVMLR